MQPFEGNLQLYITTLEKKKNAGIPHFIVLCRYCIFFSPYKLKVFDNSAWRKSISAIIPAFSYFISLSHFGNLAIFQGFSLLLSVLW